MATPNRWHFFVDESGDFSRKSQEVTVAGVLVQADFLSQKEGTEQKSLQTLLQQRLPWIPWPLHHAHIHHCLMPYLWDKSSRLPETSHHPAPDVMQGAKIREVFDSVDAHFAETTSLQEAVHRAITGNKPSIGDLNCLRGQLPRKLRNRLEDIKGVYVSKYYKAIHKLVTDSHKGSEQPVFLLFASGEAQRGDCAEREKERYLTLLEALLERVSEALLAQGGHHHVQHHIAFRMLQDGPMRTRDLKQTFSETLSLSQDQLSKHRLRLTRGSASVTFSTEKPEQYNLTADGGLIIADAIVSRLRHILNGSKRNQTLSRIEQGLTTDFALPSRFGAGGLTHLAAGGAMASTLRESRQNHPSQVTLVQNLIQQSNPQLRPWSIEQALEWTR